MQYTLIPGQSDQSSEEETMSVIRSVLTDTEEPQQEPDVVEKAEPKAAAKVDDPAPRAFVDRAPDRAPRRRATDLPELVETQEEPKHRRRLPRMSAAALGPVGAVINRVRGFQPTTRHLAIASAALLFVLRPHWFVIALVLTLGLTVGIFVTFGGDRIWRGMLAWLDRVEHRNPERASDLRAKLDAFACRWDQVLDWFPDGMVDSLYMPDFQHLQQAELIHQQVVADRLDRMAREG